MANLANKVALVTGASKGIGAAIARALAAEGAAVVVNYSSSKQGADAVVADITGAGGRAVAVKADIVDPAQADALVAAAIREFGRLDILVNNSGVFDFAPIEAFDPNQYYQMFGVNVLGLLNVTRAAVPQIAAGGTIINISSNITSALVPNSAVYSGTKGAVDAITGVLAKELGPRGIRVNALLPGMTETEGAVELGIPESEMGREIAAQTPLGGIGKPEDVAAVAVFLASDAARWVTGERIAVSGGMR